MARDALALEAADASASAATRTAESSGEVLTRRSRLRLSLLAMTSAACRVQFDRLSGTAHPLAARPGTKAPRRCASYCREARSPDTRSQLIALPSSTAPATLQVAWFTARILHASSVCWRQPVTLARGPSVSPRVWPCSSSQGRRRTPRVPGWAASKANLLAAHQEVQTLARLFSPRKSLCWLQVMDACWT